MERAVSAPDAATAQQYEAPRERSLPLPRSDELLARMVTSRGERPFRALYERYHAQIYRYCFTILSNEADAQDALQSTFTRALMALREGRRNAPLRPWLYRIAHNESISVLRARSPVVTASRHQPAAFGPSAEESADTRARLELLLADLAELAERARAALVMRELGGLSHEDIAAALQISVGAAKQAIFEARSALFELAEGRAMACGEVRRLLSNGDRRVLRRRQVRAHLRDCASCSAFAEATRARQAELRALCPVLPPAAAAAVLARAFEGAAGHGGSSAVGASASSSASTIAGAGSASAGASSTAASAAKMLAAIITPKALLTTAVVAGAAVGADGLVGSPAHYAPPALGHSGASARGSVAHTRAGHTASVFRNSATPSHPAEPRAQTHAGESFSTTAPATVQQPSAAAPVSTPGQNGTPSQTAAPPGTSATASGTSGIPPGTSGTPPATSGTPPETSGTPPGSSGNAPGNSGTPPGKGGNAPGRSGTPQGKSGNPPGKSGTPPRSGGNAPGRSGTPPGNGGSAPGKSGSPPGHGDAHTSRAAARPRATNNPPLGQTTSHGR